MGGLSEKIWLGRRAKLKYRVCLLILNAIFVKFRSKTRRNFSFTYLKITEFLKCTRPTLRSVRKSSDAQNRFVETRQVISKSMAPWHSKLIDFLSAKTKMKMLCVFCPK